MVEAGSEERAHKDEKVEEKGGQLPFLAIGGGLMYSAEGGVGWGINGPTT
jgi:hypothetical protein